MFQFHLSLTRFTCKYIGLVVTLFTKLYQNLKFWNYENSDSLIANKTKPGTKNPLAQIYLVLQFHLSLTRFTCKYIGLVFILFTKLYQNLKFWNYENSDSLIATKTKPGTKNPLTQI